MLENMPKAAGEAMQSVRAGAGKLAINAIRAPLSITVESDDFDNAQRIPPRFTFDGGACRHNSNGAARRRIRPAAR